jgi:hypothetical protein
MGAANSFEKLANIYQIILREIPVASGLHIHRSEKIKSFIIIIFENSVPILQNARSLHYEAQLVNDVYSDSFIKHAKSRYGQNAKLFNVVGGSIYSCQCSVGQTPEDLPFPVKKGIS